MATDHVTGEPMSPHAVNGLAVIALVRLPDIAGLLPHRHVVVCEMDDEPRSYVVWIVAWSAHYQGGQWTVAGSGRYDLTLPRALEFMVHRALGAL